MADVPSTVILDTPGVAAGEGEDDDDDQFVVADSTPLAPPSEDAFSKPLDGLMDEKPEGMHEKRWFMGVCEECPFSDV